MTVQLAARHPIASSAELPGANPDGTIKGFKRWPLQLAVSALLPAAYCDFLSSEAAGSTKRLMGSSCLHMDQWSPCGRAACHRQCSQRRWRPGRLQITISSAKRELAAADVSNIMDGPDITLFRRWGYLAGADEEQPFAHSSSDLSSTQEFDGRVHVDWLATTTSCIVLFVFTITSLQRVLGLDQKLLALVRSARLKKLARQSQATEQLRQSLESQFRREE